MKPILISNPTDIIDQISRSEKQLKQLVLKATQTTHECQIYREIEDKNKQIENKQSRILDCHPQAQGSSIIKSSII